MTANPQNGMTSGGLVLRALRRWGDRVAFSGHGGSVTYAQALDLVGRYQAAMTEAGAKRGDRLALLNANRADAWLAGMAAQALGLCATPLHPMGSADDQAFILEDAGIDFLLVDVDGHGERGGALSKGNNRLRRTFTLGPADYGLDLTAAAEAAGAVTAVDQAQPGDFAWLAYTGGTTGKSKGVLRRHASNVAVTTANLAEFEWPAESTFLAVAPISHVAGTKLAPILLRGGRVHLQNGFDPEAVLRTIAEQRISVALLVPTMIYLLLDHPKLGDTDLSSLDLLMYGTSPMSPGRLLEALERIGPVFCQLYGQTEGYPISVLRKGDHDAAAADLFASCGHPVSSMAVALLDEDDQPVKDGEAGEICARGPQVMDEYWRRPEQTEETLAKGWLHTGDMAWRDDRGYLYIVDRKKDMIVSGGFNVFPREVEDVLAAHPDVAMAAVIGVPDEKWGEAVKAVVVPKAGAKLDTQALIERVKASKGPVHAPKSVDVVDAIPLTAIGKPDKKVLRERYWQGQSRRVG